MSPRFEWDQAKAASNIRKHRVSFEIVQRVFADPFVLFEQDRIEEGEYCWRAVGSAGGASVLVVAHTHRDDSDDEVVRITSARHADRTERRRYEKQAR